MPTETGSRPSASRPLHAIQVQGDATVKMPSRSPISRSTTPTPGPPGARPSARSSARLRAIRSAARTRPPLLYLVAEVLLAVEIHLLASDRPILLDHPGPLARYERIDLLTRLRDPVGRRGRCPAMLVLAAGDEQSDLPLIDGREVPLITSGQRARVSLTWVENQHRAAI